MDARSGVDHHAADHALHLSLAVTSDGGLWSGPLAGKARVTPARQTKGDPCPDPACASH
jgi:hypothetical protein